MGARAVLLDWCSVLDCRTENNLELLEHIWDAVLVQTGSCEVIVVAPQHIGAAYARELVLSGSQLALFGISFIHFLTYIRLDI